MRILVVDDEPMLREFLQDLLADDGHEIQAAANGEEGLAAVQATSFDLVISDIKMPVMDGIALLRAIAARNEPTRVVILTGYGDLETAVEALKLGAYDFLLKPISPAALRNRVQRVADVLELEARAAADRNRATMAARMVAIGELAAGAAHQINNPVTFIRGNAQILRKLAGKMETADPAKREAMMADHLAQMREMLDAIETGTDRITQITKGLTAFASHHGDEGLTQTSLNACIEDALLLVEHPRAEFDVERELDPDLPPALICRRSMTQALVCLLVNATQAVTSAERQVIRVRSGVGSGGDAGGCRADRVADEDHSDNGGEGRRDENATIWVEICDSGPGIPADRRERIFEPFFTTRPVGEGIGLGLSMAYGIIHNDHQGDLRLAPCEPLGGACFRIELPRGDAAAPATRAAAEAKA